MGGEYWRKLNRQTNINFRELKKRERKENLGIPLCIVIIGSEGGVREGRQRERRSIARELFWWLTGRKYELWKVVEQGGEERFRVVNLMVVYGGLVNACSERGGWEVGQKRENGEQEGETAVGMHRKIRKKDSCK
jgi:hypothetical protein